MDRPGISSAVPPASRSTPGPSTRPIHESSRRSRQSPAPSQELADRFAGWETIDEQRAFCDERDCLDPSYNLASKNLRRNEDNVVIFDYSLDPDYLNHADGNTPVEEGDPSSGHFSAHDIFFQVPKDELIGSKQFDQIINPTKEPLSIRSRGQRLGIIDFAQCYDTHDVNLLNSMGEKLGFQRDGETTFMGAYLPRVQSLPGHGRFRTGISLRAPLKRPSEASGRGSSRDRFILFVSFPYFGRSTKEVILSPESESVTLLDFKRLGVRVSDRRIAVSEEEEEEEEDDKGKRPAEERRYDRGKRPAEERGAIGKMLVHQARYMIFDNYTMATFRSKEDSARDQAPLHSFQERIGAFRAVVHMIVNRTGSELWTLGKLWDSLCKLEEDIDQMILDAETYEDNQGMKKIPDDYPPSLSRSLETSLTEEERLECKENYERARKDNVLKRKQRRVQKLFASINNLSAALFATISVAERQIAVLQDLHNVFSTSYRTKTKDYERGYPLRRNPLYRNVVPIPILSENPEQIWPNTLDTITEVVRERKDFIKKVKELVENMDIRRKILSSFLKSDQAKAAPTERTAQETIAAIKRTEYAIKETAASTENAIRETTASTENALRETTASTEYAIREATASTKNAIKNAIKNATRETTAITVNAIRETAANTENAIRETTAITEYAIREATASTKNATRGTENAINATTDAIERTQAELVQQGRTLTSFTLVTTAFLPLSFCTSYYGMQTVREFGGKSAELSLSEFWTVTGPIFVVILLMTAGFIISKRPWAIGFWSRIKRKWSTSKFRDTIVKGWRRTPSRTPDIESGGSSTLSPRTPSQADSQAPLPRLPWPPFPRPASPLPGSPGPPSG